MRITESRRRIRKTSREGGIAFLLLLGSALVMFLGLEDLKLRRFRSMMYQVQQSTIGDFPPELWTSSSSKLRRNVSNSSLPLPMTPSGEVKPSSALNLTNLFWKDVIRFNHTICPELSAAAHYVLQSSSTILRNVSIYAIQLPGAWKLASGRWYRDNTTLIRQLIFQSNRRVLRQQGLELHALRTRPPETPGVITTNFWKFDAILNACRDDHTIDVVWFLDSDIVLQSTVIPMAVLWTYHNDYTRLATGGQELQILLSQDWRLGSHGSNMMVNCKATSALREWKHRSMESLSKAWDKIPPHYAYVPEYAQHDWNTLYEMLADVKRWKPLYPNHILHTDKKYNLVVRSTATPCPLVTYPIFLYCDANNSVHGEHVWHEPGQVAIHVAGDIDRSRRNEFLLDAIPKEYEIQTPKSLRQEAQLYIETHQEPSSNPVPSLDVEGCLRAERRYQKWLKKQRKKLQKMLREQRESS